MNREDDKKSMAPNEASQTENANRFQTSNDQQSDNDQHSYPGELDQVEGRMNNGEIGGGITKSDDDTRTK